MQKPNLKYFIGSFFLSLVAVFIATKAYIVMSLSTQQEDQKINAVEARNIELFAANEENDPIYEKYKRLSAAEAPLSTGDTTETVDVAESTVIFAESDVSGDEVLYAADDSANWISGDENFAEKPTEEILSTDFSAADSTDILNTAKGTEESEELQIVDASQAPSFTIPLKHNFKIETGVVSVSDEADASHIALASQNVSVYNLGTDNAAAVTEPLTSDEDDTETVAQNSDDESLARADNYENDDPWEVAEAANKHATKNTYGVKSEPLQQDVDLPEAEAQSKQLARRPPQNILIPVPEDILNDENLTPQFSTSEENLRIEQELRDKHQLPELLPEERIGNSSSADARTSDGATGSDSGVIPSIDDERDFDNNAAETDAEDDRTSQNLSNSIADWFDGIKTKVTGNKPQGPQTDETKGNTDKHSSIFQRLLGNKGQQQDIVPTELKLAFQPNRAEISGQTLEWLHAFADNAVQNDNVVVEIRVDRSASYEVQKKRLTLLYKILADNGVERNKVNIIFTDREPNSFIIRNVRYASDEARAEAVSRSDNPWN